MTITRCEQVSTEETLSQFRKTRLKGFGRPLIYETARLSLVPAVPTANLVPAQRYVLRSDVDSIIELGRLLEATGIDIYRLQGAVLFNIERHGIEEGPIPLTPPVIEESVEPDGKSIWLINDGMHRVSAARRLGIPINIILAEGVSADYPYYARPLPNGWNDVQELDELPDNFTKKEYRDPTNYKALFRDFNEVLPGIQKQRKRTNPDHLRA